MTNKKNIVKWAVEFISLALASAFQTLGIKAAIGLCATWDVLSLNMSEITGVKVGYVSITCNVICLLIQLAILRKRFQPIRLLQLAATLVYGLVCNLMYYHVFTFEVTSYPARFALLILSFIGVSAFLAIATVLNLVSTPAESLSFLVTEEFHIPYGWIRMTIDGAAIVSSIALSLIFGLSFKVREGTFIGMVMLGPITEFFMKIEQKLPFMKWLMSEE